MVNPGDQVNAEQNVSENAIKSEFLNKMSEIPAVNTVKEYSTAAYNQVKGYNRFTAAALSAAETTALYFAITAKPFLEKVQPQAKAIDEIACKGLTTLEEKVPYLKTPPEELVEDARRIVQSTVQMANQAATGAKNFGIQTANDVLNRTENFVDRYLPPAFGEGANEAEDPTSSVQDKASKLTSKIGLRLYGHGYKHLMPIHTMSEETTNKLSYIIYMMLQLKENYQNKTMQECVDDAKVKAYWIWDELNKEPAESKEAIISLEERAISLARRTTSMLVHAYNVTTLPLANLPSRYEEGLRTASKCAAELFTTLDQTTNASDITVSWLQTLRQKVSALEELIQQLKSQEIEMNELNPTEQNQEAPVTASAAQNS